VAFARSGRSAWKSADSHQMSLLRIRGNRWIGSFQAFRRGDAIWASLVGAVMKSLVRLRAEPGIWLQRRAGAVVGATNEDFIKVHRSAILRYRTAHLQWEPGADKPSRCSWRAAMKYSGKSPLGREVRGLFNYRRSRVGRQGHITCGSLPNCRQRAAQPMCQYIKCGGSTAHFQLPNRRVPRGESWPTALGPGVSAPRHPT